MAATDLQFLWSGNIKRMAWCDVKAARDFSYKGETEAVNVLVDLRCFHIMSWRQCTEQ